MSETDARSDPEAVVLSAPDFRRTASDEEFDAALEARSAVDLAVGITMGKHDCDRDLALATLLRTSRSFDVSLLELSRAIISSIGQ